MTFMNFLNDLMHPHLPEVLLAIIKNSKLGEILKDTEIGAALAEKQIPEVLKNMSFLELHQKIEQAEKAITDPLERQKLLSELAVNVLAAHTPARPRPFSLWSAAPVSTDPNVPSPISDYTSWPSLIDKTFSSRHLPPAPQDYVDSLPTNPITPPNATDWGPVTKLFERNKIKPGRSSVLFGYFAQWFTDSFLRTDLSDRRKNTSNHEIDLCQIYGLNDTITDALRSKVGGKLSSQIIDGEEYPDYLYEKDGNGNRQVKAKYAALPYQLQEKLIKLQGVPDSRLDKVYATGLERGNSSIGYVSMTVLFLREHNRLAADLEKRNPHWDDERLFQTARMINIVLLLRIVVQDYINHIAGHNIFAFDNSYAEQQNWYRSNWISVEFDMLYRWHGLVPDSVKVASKDYEPLDFQCNNGLLEQIGLYELLDGAGKQQTGQISLGNTPYFLLWAESMSVKMGRDSRLASFNDYRVRFGLPRMQSWDELTTDQELLGKLQALYPKGIDQLEMIVGLFAEEPKGKTLFGDTLNVMVSVDAFTQALTNPLLSLNVFKAETFTQFGLDTINDTPSLQSLVDRNVKNGSTVKATFGWE